MTAAHNPSRVAPAGLPRQVLVGDGVVESDSALRREAVR